MPFGTLLHVSVFGESHGPGIGVLLDGLPAGYPVDSEELARFLDRRRPGKNRLSTARAEADVPRFLSGLRDGVTCGTPLLAVIDNTDQRSRDYDALRDTPRPGHADYTARVRYGGFADMRGGGHFSGRLTAPLCVGGGIAKQILARHGIFIGAHILSAADVNDDGFPLYPDRALFDTVAAKPFPTLNDAAGDAMRSAIEQARADRDSVGGVVECAAVGVPAGWGGPLFEGVEGRLAAALFGIPAAKGVEFGAGFDAARRRGSENNDAFLWETTQSDGEAVSTGGNVEKPRRVRTSTNHCGGILGGITNGMPLVSRTAFKPTPSIAREQRTVNLAEGTAATLSVPGRHDPCVAHRAVPVVEAVTALVLLDLFLEYGLDLSTKHI